MELAANFVSDDAVEFDQHRDNFTMAPTDYLEYYDTAPANYQYDIE